jgi:hypothetical protein
MFEGFGALLGNYSREGVRPAHGTADGSLAIRSLIMSLFDLLHGTVRSIIAILIGM